jgi:hypothetical protein
LNIPIFLTILSIGIILSISYANGQKNETNTIEWKTYTDPEGKFTVKYPYDWNIEPRENRFDTKDVEFSIIDGGNSVHLGIVTTETPEGLDIEDGEETISQRTATRDNFRSIEPWECEKYVISNEKACSLVFTTGLSPFDFAEMDVYTIDGTTSYTIVYKTMPDLFDKYLPTAEQIIQSIKFSN